MEFQVRVPGTEEVEQGDPEWVALENARRKARAVSGPLVLAADTVVALDGRLYGKPGDEAQARAFLTALGGRTHTVITAVCVRDGGAERELAVATSVVMRPPHPELIGWYLAAGEWRGRAGGYAIQGRGAALVDGIEGEWTNVVGLPVGAVLELLPGIVHT